MTMASNRQRSGANDQRSWSFEWGTVRFFVTEPDPGFGFTQPSWVVGGDRQGLGEGVTPIYVNDLTGGLRASKAIADWASENRTRYYRNTGIYGLWLPEPKGVKSYLITTQTSVVSVDHSTFNTSNRRVHAVMWPTSSGQRFIAGALAQIYKDTSVSDPSITVPSTADNVTNNILGMAMGPIGSSQALVIVTDGQSDDAKYTTDPTANSISWTSLITYADSNDRASWCYYIPTLGAGGRWVFCGRLTDNQEALYAFKSGDTLPLTLSTLQPVVYEDGKDIIGDLPSTNTGAINPGGGSYVPGSGDTGPVGTIEATVSGSHVRQSDGQVFNSYERDVEPNSKWTPWSGLSDIVSSNDSRVTASYTHSHVFANITPGDGEFTSEADGSILIKTDILSAVEFNFDSVPLAAEGIGFVVGLERLEAASANDITIHRVQLFLDGSPIGENRADGAEVPTVEASASYGSSTDTWGVKLTGEQLRRLGVCVQFQSDDTVDHSGTVSVDTITLTIYYKYPGAQVDSTEGSWSIGPMPSALNFVPEVGPVSNDATAVNVRRELRVYEFLNDELDRVTVRTVHRPDTGLAYVKAMCHYSGGLAVAGGSTFSGLLKVNYTRQEGGSWVTDVLNFPATHGTEQQDVYFMAAQDNDLIVGVCDSDGGDRQLWKFNFDTGWHPFGALQSVSAQSISSKPLLWAESTLNTQQNYAYCFYPNSTTSLHVAREFVPPDFNADPRLVNTSVAKTANATSVTLLRQNYGPPELLKTLLSAEVQNDEVDDGTTYDTLRVMFEEGGDFTLASPGYDHTFGASAETFVPDFVPNAGLKFDTGIIGLEAGASSGTKTPNVLPVLFLFAGQYEADRTFILPLASGQDVHTIVRQLETLKRTSGPVRILVAPPSYPYFDQEENRNVPSMFVRPVLQGGQWALEFREVPGTSATS